MLAGRFAAAAPRRGCLGSGAGGGALFGGIYPGDKRIVEKSLPQALFFLRKEKRVGENIFFLSRVPFSRTKLFV